MEENNHISFAESLQALKPITLEEMDSIRLMNRIDTKYLTTEAVLLQILSAATVAGYRVLTAADACINTYRSIYYDTAGLKMFYDHHNRRLVRQKVRTRIYVSSGDSFLEIKRKNNKGRTKKKRIGISSSELMDFGADVRACEYLASHSCFTTGELSPSVETLFQRVTLVNPALTERITIDTMLRFRNFRTGKETSLQDAVIIELKQDGRAFSQMKTILLNLRVKPVRVSKYCIALTLTDPLAKTGRFKEKVRMIEKTIGNKLVTI